LSKHYQDKLSHLSSEEIETLMERYYDGEKNDILISEYNIDIRNSLLVKTFPMKTHNEELCPFCNISMYSYRESKSMSSRNNPRIFCKECQHEHNTYHCSCLHCKENRKIEEEIQKQEKELLNNVKREIILANYLADRSIYIDIEEFDIKDKLYICALLRTSLSENLENINLLSSVKTTLAPTKKYQISIISYLKNKSIIIFSPTTAIDSVMIENEEIDSYYPMNTTFRLNINEENYDEIIQRLLHLSDDEDIDDEIRIELWNEIGLFECLEFLYARMEEYNLPIDAIGDKTISAIKESMKTFSISENFNFIWRAVQNAAAFLQKDRVSKKYAVNTIAGSVLRSSEKAKAEGWDIKGYGRDYNYQQSIISEVFFNNILKIGDNGFKHKIN